MSKIILKNGTLSFKTNGKISLIDIPPVENFALREESNQIYFDITTTNSTLVNYFTNGRKVRLQYGIIHKGSNAIKLFNKIEPESQLLDLRARKSFTHPTHVNYGFPDLQNGTPANILLDFSNFNVSKSFNITS